MFKLEQPTVVIKGKVYNIPVADSPLYRIMDEMKEYLRKRRFRRTWKH